MSNLEAAVELATAGHPVFPVWGARADGSCHCELGADCQRAGKHPHGRHAPRGFLDASDDVARVEAWWRQCPEANVGLATGKTAFVVDLDVHQGEGVDGMATFAAIAASRGGLPETARARTGSGGLHLFFAADPDVLVRSQQDALVDGQRVRGVDVRGDGGYVVVPPSLHASGRRYEWEVPLERLAPAPPWLLQLLAVPLEVPAGARPPAGAAAAPAAAPRAPRGKPVVDRQVPPEVLADVVAALERVPANTGRVEWIERVSMPLHDAFGGSDEGFRLWHEWCRRGEGLRTPNGNPAYAGEDDCRKVWRSFSAMHRNPKGLPTLFEFAMRHGWRGPAGGAHGNGHAGGNGAPPGPVALPAQVDPEELAAARAGPRDPGPFPESAVHGLEGPVSELCCWIQNCSRRPDPTIAFAAALAVVAAALGRRVVGPSGTRPTIAIACLAPSGAGKDLAIACLKNVLASRPNLLVGLMDDSPTHRVQVDELLLRRRGQLILAIDEYGATLRRWLSSTDPASGSMSPALRRLVGHGDAVYQLAPVSTRHPARAANPAAWDAGIFAPAVSIVGFATPGQFYDALSESSLVDGFLGRHVVVATDSAQDLREPPDAPTKIPPAVSYWLETVEQLPIPATDRAAAVIAGMSPVPGQSAPVVDPTQIQWADEAARRDFLAVAAWTDATSRAAIQAGDEAYTAVVRRLPGQVATIALLMAAGEAMPVAEAAVAQRHVEAAFRVARWSADHLAWRLRRGVARDDVGRAWTRLQDAIERAAGRKVYLSDISRKSWLAPHAARLWKLVLGSPLYEATERWARLRPEVAAQDAPAPPAA